VNETAASSSENFGTSALADAGMAIALHSAIRGEFRRRMFNAK
jgi:hypothetical protein